MKDQAIRFRVTARELAAIEKAAKKAQLTLSSWCRQQLLLLAGRGEK